MGCCLSATKTTAPVKVVKIETRPSVPMERNTVARKRSEEVVNYLNMKVCRARNLTQLIVLDMLG